MDLNKYQNQYPRLYESLTKAEAMFPEQLACNFERILQRVELLWGSKEASAYLDSLFLGDSPDRTGRQGFPLKILQEIVLLKQMHDFLFPSLDINPYDPFSGYSLAAPVRSSGEPEATPASTPSIAPPSTQQMSADARTHKAHLDKQMAWPIISSPRELIASAKLWHKGKNFYVPQEKSLGDILLHYGFLDGRTLRIVQNMQEKPEHRGKNLGQLLVEIGIIRHDDLIRAQCIQAGVLMVNVLEISISFETLKTIPSALAREKQAIPIGSYQGTLFLAVADPLLFNDHQTFSSLTGFKINPVFAPRHEIVNRLNSYS